MAAPICLKKLELVILTIEIEHQVRHGKFATELCENAAIIAQILQKWPERRPIMA